MAMMIPCELQLCGQTWRLRWRKRPKPPSMAVAIYPRRRLIVVNRQADRGALAGQMATAIALILTGEWPRHTADRLCEFFPN